MRPKENQENIGVQPDLRMWITHDEREWMDLVVLNSRQNDSAEAISVSESYKSGSQMMRWGLRLHCAERVLNSTIPAA